MVLETASLSLTILDRAKEISTTTISEHIGAVTLAPQIYGGSVAFKEIRGYQNAAEFRLYQAI